MNMKPIIDGLVDDWIEAIAKDIVDTQRVVDFGHWGEFLTYDIITRLCFGEPYGFIKSRTDKDGLIEGLHKSLPLIGILSRLPGLAWAVKAIGLVPKAGDKNGLGLILAQRDKLLDRRINERKNGAEKRHDILEHLLEAQPNMSLFDIKSDLFFFMTAGSDTSGSFFRSFFISVLTNPDTYKEVIEELLSNLDSSIEKASGNSGHGASTSGMSLLDACIKETLRHAPPVPLPFDRIVGPGGLFVHSETVPSISTNKTGVFIPEGTEMAASMLAINRDPSVYGPDAEVWNPYRWIECSKEKLLEMDKYLYSFGYSSRICLGKPIAELEIELGLKKFLTNFEAELVYPERPVEKVEDYGVLVHHGLWMRIKRRELSSRVEKI